jgi:hypothetical protein
MALHGYEEALVTLYVMSGQFRFSPNRFVRGPFEKFMDSPYYSESELCGGAVTVSFTKYLPWQAMHFLQRSTHFTKNVLQTFDHFQISCLGAPFFMVGKAQK